MISNVNLKSTLEKGYRKMHKRIRMIIKNIQNLYNSDTIKRMAENIFSPKRKVNLVPKTF